MIIVLLFIIGFLGLSIMVFFWSILAYLDERNIRVEFWKPNWRFFEYVRLYKQMTFKETGHVGVYFYLTIVFCLFSVILFSVVVTSFIVHNYHW